MPTMCTCVDGLWATHWSPTPTADSCHFPHARLFPQMHSIPKNEMSSASVFHSEILKSPFSQHSLYRPLHGGFQVLQLPTDLLPRSPMTSMSSLPVAPWVNLWTLPPLEFLLMSALLPGLSALLHTSLLSTLCPQRTSPTFLAVLSHIPTSQLPALILCSSPTGSCMGIFSPTSISGSVVLP